MLHNQAQILCTLQLECDLCDSDGLSHEKNFDEYRPAILQLAKEEATHSPRMKNLILLTDDGKM